MDHNKIVQRFLTRELSQVISKVEEISPVMGAIDREAKGLLW